MNNPQVRAWARGFAKRIDREGKASFEEAVRAGYLIALARPPRTPELADSVAFLNEQMKAYPAPIARDNALADFCQVLMCLNEAVYVD